MTTYICTTCGVQYAESPTPPLHCPICEDERQYVGWQGQQWTTMEHLRAEHTVVLREDMGLTGLGAEPGFAISQCALLVPTPDGRNILWDCISLVDEASVERVRALGGLAGIAISHPHFYASMVEWSRAMGNAPIYLHADDRQWVMRPDPAIVFWEGETHSLADGLTLIRCGGHFAGSTVLHWADGAEGRGALLTGDTITVVPDRRYVSFMYSYPDLIPLPAQAVRRIVEAVRPFAFDRVYGGWWGRNVEREGHAAVERSAQRYLRAIGATV